MTPGTEQNKQAQSWWQENKIKAEKYHYSKRKYDVVLVGSSMSEEIDLEPFLKNTITINFIGGSSLTGLELVKNSASLPNILIVETNWLERPGNEELISTLKSTTVKKITNYIPSLLEYNQPVNIASYYLDPLSTYVDQLREQSYFAVNLQKNVVAEQSGINVAQAENSIKKAKALIDFFKQRGTKVYLMDLPMDPALYHGNRYLGTKNIIAQLLGNEDRIPAYPVESELTTSDGYHFVKDSRKKYSRFLYEFLAQQTK